MKPPPACIPPFVVVPDRAALARYAAEQFVAHARAAIAARGRFVVALAGGATPRAAYALLATPAFATRVEWARVHVFFGDERAVPPDHPDSNFRMAHAALLAHVPVSPQNVHRIRAELPPAEAAREYEQTLREFFQVDARVPSFDLIWLGLGADGHTASLLPRTRVLREQTRWVAAIYARRVKMWRVTLTLPIINAATNILFLVAGADKADAVRAVWRGVYRPYDLPAQLVQPHAGQVVCLLDKAAGRTLASRSRTRPGKGDQGGRSS